MRYRRKSGLSQTDIDDELFLVDVGAGELFYLDRSARGLWNLLDEPSTFESILATFREAFPDTPAAQIERDLRQVLIALMGRGLVITVP
ncbi:MAG TPA: PqqD family protein [Alphaproteobacteria bacterium]|nr:PqqD family protein [Alphaproteobacteria bacterium]